MAKAEKTTGEDDGAAKKGGGLLGTAMIGAAALIGSFGTSFFLGGSSSATTPATCLPGTESVPGYDEMTELPKDLSDQIHVQLPEILITIGSTPADRFLKMNVSVTTDKEGSKLISNNEEVLMDAFITYLRSMELSDFEDPRYFAEMRDQLSHRAELVLGTQHARGVLVTEFLLR